MAKENATLDENNRAGILGHDPSTKETRRVNASRGRLSVDSMDTISVPGVIGDILRRYNAVALYSDDFGKHLDLRGWREQFDSSAASRTGLTLTDEARMGGAALQLHTRASASDEAWMRKGHVVPDGVTKVIKWCYFMFHAANVNNPGSINFDFDYQMGTGTNAGTNRRFWRFRYLNHDGAALQQKWQVNTGSPTAQAFTDIANGYMPVGWNESEKPLLCYMLGVFNIATQKYEKLFANGLELDVSAQDLSPTAGASLTNYDKGSIDINTVNNRANAAEDCLVQIEYPGLAYVF